MRNFWEKYGTVRKYGITFSVSYTFRTPVMHAMHFCLEVLHFFHFCTSLFAYNLTTSVALAAHHSPLRAVTISNNNIVKKLNCYAVITVQFECSIIILRMVKSLSNGLAN